MTDGALNFMKLLTLIKYHCHKIDKATADLLLPKSQLNRIAETMARSRTLLSNKACVQFLELRAATRTIA